MSEQENPKPAIQNTEHKGDTAVSRNLTVGGSMDVKGRATIKGNVTIDGWLDARNIKGANKGVFVSKDRLTASYPHPHDGWWAVVGNSFPAPLYIAEGGQWSPAGGNVEVTLDSQAYNDQAEEITNIKAILGDMTRADGTSSTPSVLNINNLGNRLIIVENATSTHTNDINAIKAEMANKGKANGLATLDESGKVPSSQLPAFVDDVIEFGGMSEGYTLVSQEAGVQDLSQAITYDPTKGKVQYDTQNNVFVWVQMHDTGSTIDFVGLTIWDEYEQYGTPVAKGVKPDAGKVYLDVEKNKTYRWSGTQLVVIGSDLALGETESTAFAGDKGKQLADKVADLETATKKTDGLAFFNVTNKTGSSYTTLQSAINALGEGNTKIKGAIITFLQETSANNVSDYKWVTYQWKASKEDECTDANWLDPNMWNKFGGGTAAVGNTLNATVEIPLGAGEFYLDLKDIDPEAEQQKYNVLKAIINKGLASVGLQITFSIANKQWKSYQYIGPNTTPEQFENILNWIDLAGMSAGGESVINVDHLCGACQQTTYYTLEYAIAAISALQQETGIAYKKSGLVITYQSGENTWETKQFKGQASDFGEKTLWFDFGGGGGAAVNVSGAVEKGNNDAVSSDAVAVALDGVLAGFNADQDQENYIFQGVNKDGTPIEGAKIEIPKSNSTGSQSGSTLNIYPETQAVWGAFGSKLTLRAAIKSVSFDGDTEIRGTIKTIAIEDAITKIELWSSAVNKPSSTSATNYSFAFDFTDYVSEASSKDFIIRATDADGNKKSRTITVTAVDVTCELTNTLNYSKNTALNVNGETKSFTLYKFPRNVSRQGVTVEVQMLWQGTWKSLGTAQVNDQYSHNIAINPKDVFGGGEAMQHGAYPIKIQGTDNASGVKGNVAYTAVMCIDSESTKPVVAMRYYDNNDGKIRLYDSLNVDFAAYTPGKVSTQVKMFVDGHAVSNLNAMISQVYRVSKQVQGYASDGSKTIPFYAEAYNGEQSDKSAELNVIVQGSAIDAVVKDGALFDFDFSTRSNDEEDHTIESSGYTMLVEGTNYSSNGFCEFKYYEDDGKTEKATEQVLRIAENVRATIPWQMFGSTALETSGAAFQMAFSTKSIKDADAKLCECYDPASGAGFYVTGNKVVLAVQDGTPSRQEVTFKNEEKITIAVVVEPGTKYVTYNGTNYSFVKLYVNGEECAAIGYKPNTSALRQTKEITFNSELGDINLHYAIAYNSYMEWLQAFQNYLCKLSDVSAMIAEYDAENVLDTTGKPSLSMMQAHGIPYYVVVADQTTFDNYDFALNGGTDTSDVFACTLYYFNPQHPELDFKAENAYWRRQGTTSAKRPIKNDRFNLNKKFKTGDLKGKKATVTLQHPDDTTELGRKAIKAAQYNKVLVDPDGFAVDVITVKVDYSDSSNANDCGVCNMMNATFRALGSDYMTPAQRNFDGTQPLSSSDVLTGIKMDHSTKNHPIAAFRATQPTLQDAWFHAKGNWKEDKGEQTALGFKDTPGYNKGCLNYGDFVEFFGNRDETLPQLEQRFKTSSGLDSSKVYLLSLYCGRDYAIYRYVSGAWTRSTGTMKQNESGKWEVTGDVLNPVSGYELLQYAGMDWWQGVATIDDMMQMRPQKSSWVTKLKLSATEYPAWTFYFECMIDDDQLQKDLALGKKVPYDLFNMLRFFDSCDYSKGGETWQQTWKENAYKYMSIESAMAYTAFTDYLAAVDQRAKNMQPMFFLEDGCQVVDGHYESNNGIEPIRMYCNKIYDCDTCNGSDNDGGRGIDPEVDPNKPTDDSVGYSNPYMGSGSVLFNDIDKQPEVWTSAGGASTQSLKAVVNRMRTLNVSISGGPSISPFSPAGAMKYFVNDILEFWPKVVSSYDGERKYINHTHIADAIYFYALHGLGRTALPRFIEQRWLTRDGYYQTGDFQSDKFGGRIGATKGDDSKIYITAAKTGYFGIGNDASGQLSEAVFLEAGQSHAFTNFAKDAGALLYIYQPGRLKKIDLSELTLNSEFGSLGSLKLAEEIILGGEKHTANVSLNNFENLGTLNVGDLPFLRKLDVSHTTVTSIDASKCPRLEEVIATDTPLTQCSVAQTSPISSMKLPDTITRLELVNLPNLSYPGGLEIAGLSNVNRLWLEGCPKVDTESLTRSVADGGKVKEIRLPKMNISGGVDVLRKLKTSGAVGLDASGTAYEEAGRCSGLTGRWILTDLIENSELSELDTYFQELTIYNCQYSAYKEFDNTGDPKRITNLDNKTGYDYNNDYVASGHIVRIHDASHAFSGKLNTATGKLQVLKRISDENYNKEHDDTDFNHDSQYNSRADMFLYIPHFWYKGINDFKKQEKYTLLSSDKEKPIDTYTRINNPKLSECLYQDGSGIKIASLTVGSAFTNDLLDEMSGCAVYRIDVEGMKQVRYVGMNDDEYGSAFVDAEGIVLQKDKLSISGTNASPLDFKNANGDYIFRDVPQGAKWLYWTCLRSFSDDQVNVLSVDSSDIEAIEPGWEEHKSGDVIGIYAGSVDDMGYLRSVSGKPNRRGTGTHTTSTAWKYDSAGNPTNLVKEGLNYSVQDLFNLCRYRGEGFHSISFAQSSMMCFLSRCWCGNINDQQVYGFGQSADFPNTGNLNSIGRSDTQTGAGMNKVWGLEAFIACMCEWCDYIGINITDWKTWKANRRVGGTVDGKWHIYDPYTDSERVVQGLTNSGQNIARLKHGRYCDCIPSSVSSDTSLWTTGYCAAQWYSGDSGRVLLRSSYSAGAFGGLACASADVASSLASSFCGVRLAFTGELENEELLQDEE